jgi:formylglycine-generating enzyme required for sulfatase activity
VFRGGSWSYIADYCRVAYRNYSHPVIRDYLLGFRLAFVPQSGG